MLQVVGFQNSGKTTLVSKLVERVSNTGLSVGTIKHHGHGGEPYFGDSGKDTERHRLAGASVVCVEGAGSFQITALHHKWDLTETLSLYRHFELDVVLIEGYKQEDYPKVVLVRDSADLELLDSVTNIVCVISIIPITEPIDFPFFLRSEERAYMTYLTEQIRG